METNSSFLILLSFLLLIKSSAGAQNAGVRTNGADMVIPPGTTVIVPGNVRIGSADYILNDGNIYIAGDFTNNGNSFSTAGAGTEIFNGSTIINGISNFNNVTINSDATVTLSSDMSIYNNWTNNGSLIPAAKAVTFRGSSDQTITGNTVFYDLTENQTGGFHLIFAAAQTIINHNLTITAGTMSPDNNTLIEFTGTGNLQGINNKSFYDLQIDNTSAITITNGGVSISHNFVNNGTYTYSGASRLTTFGGSGISQLFFGSATSSTTFGTVVVGDNHPLSSAITLNCTGDYIIKGGSLSLSHGSTLNNTNNTVNFSTSASASVSGTGTANFYNVITNIPLDFGTSPVISTINNNLTINTGGAIINHSPNYTSSSTLIYNTLNSTYNTGFEWTGNTAFAGIGTPQNIIIQNTNSIILTGDRTLPGNLNITAGEALNINGTILTLNGTVSGTGTLTGSAASGLIIGGNAGILYFDQTTNNTTNILKTFTLKDNADATLGNALSIAAGTYISPGTLTANTGSTLHTDDVPGGGVLTIKSDANGDARIAESYGTIKGNVVVERYIPARRAWRFITAPVKSSQTINAAWQEGQVNTGYALGINRFNDNPGFGTEITYDNLSANGYDFNTTLNPSIRVWDPAINNFVPLPAGTKATNINDYPGYYLFVRGSRAIDLSQAISALPDPTVLRVKGTLAETGQNSNIKTVTSSTILQPNQYFLLGNPYASPVDISTAIDGTSRTGGYMPNQFWIWDPTITGSYGVGGYVAFSNGMQAPVRDPVYTAGTIIQSGQAFMVRSNTNAYISLEFHQEDKHLTETQVFGKSIQNPPAFYTNLMIKLEDSLMLIDGVAAAFDENNSAGIDEKDASKKWNITEGIGLYRSNTWQAIEFRPIPILADTLFYYLNNIQQKSYTLQIMTQHVPAGFPQAWLVDKYLNTKTAVNTDTVFSYNFTANSDVNSYRNRFMLVFKRTFIATPVPVTKVANQANPGTTGNASSMATQAGNVSVHPNPIKTGEKVMLQFSNMAKEKYQVTVTNTAGKVLAEKTIEHAGGSSSYSFQTDARWAAGSYFIKITGENGCNLVTKLIIGK